MAANGCILQQWSVDPLVLWLLNDLHHNSWIQYGDLQSIIVTAKGGRQSCKVGSLVFNTAYSAAVQLLKERLLQSGVRLRVHASPEAFWSSSERCNDECDVIDVAFVDDLCLMVMSVSAAGLSKDIRHAVEALASIFDDFGLAINWGPGKSECLVKFRGAGAVEQYHANCVDGKLCFAVPCDGEIGVTRYLHAVNAYKHLGALITTSESVVLDARHKERMAMSAYSPIAYRVFGSDSIDNALKCHSKGSLVDSCLFYTSHVIVPTPAYIRVLNGVHMRVLRRIAAEVRFDSGTASDRAVRERLCAPSVDCLLIRRRLSYFQAPGLQVPAYLAGSAARQAPRRAAPMGRIADDGPQPSPRAYRPAGPASGTWKLGGVRGAR